MKTTRLLRNSIQYVFLTLLVLMAVVPFVWLFSTALKSGGENLFRFPPRFVPEHPTLENFIQVWQQVPMGRYLTNSLCVAAITVGLNLAFSTLAAYPLACMKFKGQQAVLLSVLATMMIPFQVIMIPLYLIMLKLGMTTQNIFPSYFPVNIWLGLAIPFALSGFGIFFIRQALLSIPKELQESAVLDGATSYQVLRLILLPLIKPTLATLAVFTFMASWGEFLWPSILLSETQHYTLPVGLVHLQGTFSANWRLVAAGTISAMAPMVLFFMLAQRYFVTGSLSGAIK